MSTKRLATKLAPHKLARCILARQPFVIYPMQNLFHFFFSASIRCAIDPCASLRLLDVPTTFPSVFLIIFHFPFSFLIVYGIYL